MAAAITQISKDDKLGVLLGLKLVDTEPGIGSLNYLIFINANKEYVRLWLYMADWVFLRGDEEIASCETPGIGQNLNLSEYFGLKISEIYKFEDDEIHIIFGDKLRLEIWENVEAYGNDEREFFLIFQELENSKFQFSYP